MKRIVVILLVLCTFALLFASDEFDSFFPHLSEEELKELKSGNKKELCQWENDISSYIANGTMMKTQAIKNCNYDGAWSVAVVNFIPYPEEIKAMTPQERHVHLYNILRRISKLKGITYISHSAGEKPAVLFKDAYMISNPNDIKSKIDDPVSDSVPSKAQYYCYQKDAKFGGNVYTVDYVASSDEIILVTNNCKPVKVMGITGIPANALYMYLGVKEFQEGFAVCGLGTIFGQPKQINAVVKKVDLPSAITKRIVSLGNWFEEQVKI